MVQVNLVRVEHSDSDTYSAYKVVALRKIYFLMYFLNIFNDKLFLG